MGDPVMRRQGQIQPAPQNRAMQNRDHGLWAIFDLLRQFRQIGLVKRVVQFMQVRCSTKTVALPHNGNLGDGIIGQCVGKGL